ncbi:MAG TPA: DUF2975 domain-containing protein [Caulobacteraceae bacterium]|nr:DUF2975 domain-containing protein [Caulobacteraceae bacterium]
MRAMGPGSVSSLLKIAMDVVWVVLLIGIAVLGLAALAVLFVPIPEDLTVEIGSGSATLTRWLAFAALLMFAGYIAILGLVVGRVRRIFATLTAGDPFHPANVTRLRQIGIGLAALEGANLLIPILLLLAAPDADFNAGVNFDLTAWFSVLVVFVMAEVFREGARLRREAELTI